MQLNESSYFYFYLNITANIPRFFANFDPIV